MQVIQRGLKMQIAHFTTGGYVVHKAQYCGRKYSAWFDASGKLIDAQGFSGTKSIRVGETAKQFLQAVYGDRKNTQA
jgi:hypothetical protein